MKSDVTLTYIVANNIKYLCKLQGRAVSELESELFVSTGYFSNIKSRGGHICVSVAYPVAKMLGVTVDDLLTKDYEVEYLKQRIEAAKRASRNAEETLAYQKLQLKLKGERFNNA